MKNTALTAKAVRAAINSRIDSEIAASGAADKQLYTALNSTRLYADDILVKGFEIVAALAKVKPAELLSWFAVTDKKNTRFIPQKGVDKCVRMALFFGGARIDNAIDPEKAKKRKGVIDSFTSALFNKIAVFAALPRNERGQIIGKRPTVEMNNEEGFEMYSGFVIDKVEFEALLNSDRYVDQSDMYRPDLAQKAWAEGGLNFNPGTSKTQVSQLRSTLTALGLAESKKNEKPQRGEQPKMTISPRLALAISRAVAKNPIPREWMEI